MTFSEYAQTLYPYLGQWGKETDFVLLLVEKIMDETFLKEKGDNHPLAKFEEDTLMRFYRGTREFSKQAARVVLRHMDQERFYGFLSRLDSEAMNSLHDAMKPFGIKITSKKGYKTCTDLFVAILEDCAGKKNRRSANLPKLDIKAKSHSIAKKPTAPERMVDVFYQAIKDYPVEDFMERNPVDSLSTDRIRDAISFVGHIRYKSQAEDIPDKNEDIYQEILWFTDSLLEYLRFLKSTCVKADNFPEGYQPPRDDNEFVTAADHHRQQLKTLYQALQEKVDKIMDEDHKRRQEEHKKAWDENTQKGIL